MFKVKHVPFLFAFYDRTGIQAFLEREASKGWQLEKVGAVFWEFRRADAKRLHYSVTYLSKLEPGDPASDARKEDFTAYCAHGGWELAADNSRMLIFRSELDDPVPLETDAVMEVENIHRAAKKSYLPLRLSNMVTAVLLIISFAGKVGGLPIHLLISASTILYLLCLVLLLTIPLTEVILYFLWLVRARRAAALDGSFLPTGSGRFHRVLRLSLFASALLLLICLGLQLSVPVIIGVCIIFFGTVLIRRNVSRMQREGHPRSENRIYTAILAVLLGVAAVVIVGILLALPGTKEPEAYNAPLHRYHLDESAFSDENCTARKERSLFATQAVVNCGEEGERLTYNVLDVKLGVFYPIAFQYFLSMYEDPIWKKILGEDFDPTFRETDAGEWGAEAAYYLYHEKLGGHMYILCYKGRVVYICFPHLFTAEQMYTVKELLGT